MDHHVVACALCSTNPHASQNWLWVLGIGIPVLAIGITVQAVKEKDAAKRKAAGLPPKPPREPMDISPGTAALLSGQGQQACTAAVNAVTPAGIRVRQRRCCARGHRSPGLAVQHADAIKRRIETTGR
jgi:hypothetical protein